MTVVLRVRCPYCGFEQKTKSIKRVRCFRCLKTFPVFYRRGRWIKRHNIVKLEQGSLQELWKLYYEVYGRKKK